MGLPVISNDFFLLQNKLMTDVWRQLQEHILEGGFGDSGPRVTERAKEKRERERKERQKRKKRK